MISVLICSGNSDLLQQVSDNITETIGVEFEIIFVDNRVSNNGICSVYNELALKAKFPYLCFLHEDILFTRKDWGRTVMNNFSSDEKIGLIGLGGCKYKSAYFSGWFSNAKELDCANYIHKYKTGIEKVHLSPSNDNSLQEVVCIDGVFMCCRKEVWALKRFNNDFLKGFHFYDIDFSVRVAHDFKVVITYDIEMMHITSGGDYGNNWVETAITYHQMVNNELPFSKIPVDAKSVDKKVIKATLDFLKNYNISIANKMKWVTFQKLYLFPQFYYSIIKFLFYKPLGLRYIHFSQRTK